VTTQLQLTNISYHIIKESKQGASTTADLLKQKPHEEILESKPSTASSDEEKLAAGISTIGLQAKRLSGAQREKLVRDRNVTEKEQTLAFSTDPDSFKALAQSHFKAFCGLGRIICRTLKEAKKNPEAESITCKSGPQ